MADPIDWTSLLGTLGSSAVGAVGTNYAANQAADAARQSAQQAAQMAQFRPVGVTTRFGKSGFNYDPTTGQLIGAGYQVAPDVAGLREGLLGMASTGLGQAQQVQGIQPNINEQARGLFNLGAQYVAQTPQAAAQQYMTQQQQLLAPGREQQLAQTVNQQQQQGRLGLATGATTAGYTQGGQGLMASNPQLAALYNARSAQDAQLAAQAQQMGQQQATFGQNLMTGGLNLSGQGFGLQTQALAPYSQYMQGATGIENQGMNALTAGQSLGSLSATSAAEAARQYAAGQSTANQAQRAALQGTVAGLTDPISQLIKGLANPAAGAGYQQAVNYAATSPTGWLDF